MHQVLSFHGSLNWQRGTAADSGAARDAPTPAVAGHALATAAGTIHVAAGRYALVAGEGISAIVISGDAAVDRELTARAIHAARLRGRELCLQGFAEPAVVIVVDAVRREVIIATDRFGTVPVYYTSVAQGLDFAADLRTLPASDRAVDPQAIYNYVFFHCIPSPSTIYQGIAKLRPAEYLQWTAQGARALTYWMPDYRGSARPDLPALAAELRDSLRAAVSERATAHTGAFLSGGLDSSTVAGMLKQADAGARTFTIGFKAEGYDEAGFARTAAAHFGTRHHEYYVTEADVVEAVARIFTHFDEPFGNSSALPAYYCARHAQAHGVTAMLAGDGGDELFAGNTRYMTQRVFEAYFALPALVRKLLQASYARWPALQGVPLAGKGHRYIQQALMGLPERLQSYNFLHRYAPASVFAADWLRQIDTEAPWALWRERYTQVGGVDSLHAMLYLDWKFTLADNDFVKVNNMCALAGIDVTYPMVDRRVVAVAEQLSATTLLLDGELRGFYKYAFRQFLPRATLAKTKQGFGLPFGVWLTQNAALKAMAGAALASLGRRGIFLPAFIAGAGNDHGPAGAGYYGELVWILMALEHWLQAHVGEA